jgi:protein farnesyltransferase subunit beta
MHGQPIEGGGFRGRSNKLVDGCYGWWNGALFTILSALTGENAEEAANGRDSADGSDPEWEDEGEQRPRRRCVQG